MKKFTALTLIYIFAITNAFSQQETESGYYKLRKKLKSQNTVYMKIGNDTVTLKKGWLITETKGGKTIQRILSKDTIIVQKKEIPVKVLSNWKIGEVKHSDDSPGKLIINPHFFTNPKDSLLNNKSYIKIPENSSVTLVRYYTKWNAITIPFAIRGSLNDTIGSKITTDLKIGASFSFNINKEIFKNRRIKAKKSIYGISGGIGFGFSKVTLDSSSTSLLDKPYKNSEDGLAFFIAPGIGINLKGFQVNFSYGWDLPITSNVKDWNYSKLGYFGIGLGIGLDTFGKQ
jgi:hypothetical protein